jgi:hypothetical protein
MSNKEITIQQVMDKKVILDERKCDDKQRRSNDVIYNERLGGQWQALLVKDHKHFLNDRWGAYF